MDQATLRGLIRAAANSDKVPSELADALCGEFSCDTGEVNRIDLLHTYRRRLSKVTPGTDLYDSTKALVEFLENSADNTFQMVSIRPKNGGFELFLTDENESEILFWMKIFSQHP